MKGFLSGGGGGAELNSENFLYSEQGYVNTTLFSDGCDDLIKAVACYAEIGANKIKVYNYETRKPIGEYNIGRALLGDQYLGSTEELLVFNQAIFNYLTGEYHLLAPIFKEINYFNNEYFTTSLNDNSLINITKINSYNNVITAKKAMVIRPVLKNIDFTYSGWFSITFTGKVIRSDGSVNNYSFGYEIGNDSGPGTYLLNNIKLDEGDTLTITAHFSGSYSGATLTSGTMEFEVHEFFDQIQDYIGSYGGYHYVYSFTENGDSTIKRINKDTMKLDTSYNLIFGENKKITLDFNSCFLTDDGKLIFVYGFNEYESLTAYLVKIGLLSHAVEVFAAQTHEIQYLWNPSNGFSVLNAIKLKNENEMTFSFDLYEFKAAYVENLGDIYYSFSWNEGAQIGQYLGELNARSVFQAQSGYILVGGSPIMIGNEPYTFPEITANINPLLKQPHELMNTLIAAQDGLYDLNTMSLTKPAVFKYISDVDENNIVVVADIPYSAYVGNDLFISKLNDQSRYLTYSYGDKAFWHQVIAIRVEE